MDTVLRNLSDHASLWLLLLIVGFLGLLLAIYIVGKKSNFEHARWQRLLEGTRGETLEKLLYEHLRDRMATQERIESLEARASELERRGLSSKQYVGLVRYDAFPDVGGSQSFALAIFDDRGDGCVVTSLVGRVDCRVYCKPLTGGRSDRTLSQEEQRAIKYARSDAPKPIITQ
jgi:hypothetical protein